MPVKVLTCKLSSPPPPLPLPLPPLQLLDHAKAATYSERYSSAIKRFLAGEGGSDDDDNGDIRDYMQTRRGHDRYGNDA
jgi:hypothetical protein